MPKLIRLDHIVSRIKSGAFIALGYVHSGFMPLFDILKTLNCNGNVEVFIPCILRYRPEYIFPLDRAVNGFKGRILITQIAPEYSSLLEKENIDILPLSLSKAPEYLKEQARKHNVWTFIEVSPPNEQGFCNTGYSVPFPPQFYNECNTVALINEKIPPTFGDSAIPIKSFKYFARMQDIIPFFPEPIINEPMVRIGEYAADLIENGATIEAGVGEINCSILRALCGRKKITFHSGLIPEEIIDLVEEGCITGMVTGNITAARTARLYEWIKMNSRVEIKAINYTHDIFRNSNEHEYTAIGSALCIDLLGQVVSETIGHKQITGIGGALDFARASVIGGGKSIIALTSTLAKDNRSKIVPVLNPGEVISLTRHDVDYVITEFGIAELKYKSRETRARNLISVAHPKHRERLTRIARELNLL